MRRIRARGASPAEPGQVHVLDTCVGERVAERALAELRIPPGARRAADIGEQTNAGIGEGAGEVLGRRGAVTDAVDQPVMPPECGPRRSDRGRGKLHGDAEVALMARVVSLQLHEGHGKPMRAVPEAPVRVGGGIEGDSHAQRSKRAVTVVDRSTHDAVGETR